MNLIERIEGAEGESAALDVMIWRTTDPQSYSIWEGGQRAMFSRDWDEARRQVTLQARAKIATKRFTASLDAAMSLVPDGWRPYSADMSVKGRTRFLIEGPKMQWATDSEGEKCAGNDWYSQGAAATPALALCAAALRAIGDAHDDA